MNKPNRPESERAIAARLANALELNICRATVRRLREKGIDVQDPEKVRHALAMQERRPRRIGCATKTSQPEPTAQKPKAATRNQAAPRIVADEDIKRRADEISTGEALFQIRDFCEWLIDVAPDYLETMDVEEMREWLRAECEKHVAHLLEIWP